MHGHIFTPRRKHIFATSISRLVGVLFAVMPYAASLFVQISSRLFSFLVHYVNTSARASASARAQMTFSRKEAGDMMIRLAFAADVIYSAHSFHEKIILRRQFINDGRDFVAIFDGLRRRRFKSPRFPVTSACHVRRADGLEDDFGSARQQASIRPSPLRAETAYHDSFRYARF